jgi:hypothetical protein
VSGQPTTTTESCIALIFLSYFVCRCSIRCIHPLSDHPCVRTCRGSVRTLYVVGGTISLGTTTAGADTNDIWTELSSITCPWGLAAPSPPWTLRGLTWALHGSRYTVSLRDQWHFSLAGVLRTDPCYGMGGASFRVSRRQSVSVTIQHWSSTKIPLLFWPPLRCP